MNDLRTAAQQALEALEAGPDVDPIFAGETEDALRAALAEPVQEPVACSNTFGCQCPKHFASQQLEQRPKRVLTAVWRDRARRAEAQRDALLEALKEIEWSNNTTWQRDRASGAIKAVEDAK